MPTQKTHNIRRARKSDQTLRIEDVDIIKSYLITPNKAESSYALQEVQAEGQKEM